MNTKIDFFSSSSSSPILPNHSLVFNEMKSSYVLEIPDEALKKIGSSWFYDSAFLFVFPTVGLFSFVGNLISFWILSGPYFSHKPLYTYLKAICLNSSLANLVSMMNILWNTRRYLNISNSEFASLLRCYIKIPVAFGTYFYGSVLDIVLALERLCELSNRREIFRRFPPNRVCLVILLVCFIINFPFLFVFVPNKTPVFFDPVSNKTEYLYHYTESEFALSKQGRILKIIVYFIRDFLTLAILILINLISLFRFRRIYYHQEPSSLRASNQLDVQPNNADATGAKTSMLMFNITSNQTDPSSEPGDAINGHVGNKKSLLFLMARQHEHMRTKWHFSVAKVNNLLTKMVLIISTLSACEHLFVTLILHYFSTNKSPIEFIDLNVFIFLANLSTLIKNSINIFIFYHFNDFFRVKFKNLISSAVRCRICFSSVSFNMEQNK